MKDAAVSTGFAAVFVPHWFAGPWPQEILLIPGFSQLSSLFELYPIIAAAQVWGHTWIGQTVVFSMNNLATAETINKGRSKSLVIMSFLCRLMQTSLQYKLNVHCTFISGKCKVTVDALPR